MKKIEIKSIFGGVLFTYTNENATIKDAVEQAVKEKVSLQYADLRCADLRGADFSFSDLSFANFKLSDLSSANFSSADLTGVNFHLANLSSANLSSAKNKEIAYLPIFCKWQHAILGNNIQIGCVVRTIEDWDAFFAGEEEYLAKRNTENFKQIQATYEAYKAYLLFLNK